ncbi:DUF4145 domain-containing protein [Paenibacillus alba]|uniref:DUF4145 domain-containing protein n=1 Tax=Paenibacillus alba TaxID=1197127 RepID=UPI0015661964|nr:DUF4145 domain-containing protein [Paenibacillus alba]NQX66660.1 DUF4145 domain-containing protein [Paenibacillus alba]
MIDSLEGLKRCVMNISEYEVHGGGFSKKLTKIVFKPDPHGNMYCPKCGDVRKMKITNLFPQIDPNEISQIGLNCLNKDEDKYPANFINKVNQKITPSLWKYSCLQCSTYFTGLIYNGQSGQDLNVLSNCNGGLTTPNTPESVAYYLDQASRAQSVRATSAAMAMYRAALEHILFDQGFTEGMLGGKLKTLEKAINNGTAPKWALELETEFLKYIKDMGNGAIHSNDGNIEQQAIIDNDLLQRVTEVFRMLLFVIYEIDIHKKKLLESFRTVANTLNK